MITYFENLNVKKNYRKIGKKNDNDVDADVAQLKRSNNKYYASTFRYIQIASKKINGLGFLFN